MSIHYYCLIHQQKILVHTTRNTILFEHEDFIAEQSALINWKEVKSYRNGTQIIHYYTLADEDPRSSTLDFLKVDTETQPTWLPLTQISNLNKTDMVTLAYICEGELLDPDSDLFWIDLAKSLFTAHGQYWSPAHYSYCLRRRNRKALISTVAQSKLRSTILWSLVLGFGLNGLLLGKLNGLNSFVYILMCLCAITYTSENKPTSRKSQLLLAVSFVISIQFVIFNNPFTNFLNSLAIPPLLGLYALSLKTNTTFLLNLDALLSGVKQLLASPFSNLQDLKPLFSRYTKNLKLGDKRQPRKEILLGLALSIPILLICGALLASSDAMFNNLIASNFEWLIDWFSHLISFRGVAIITMTLYTFGFLWQLMMPQINSEYLLDIKKSWSPLVVITLLISINLMYLIFTGIQISFLYARFSQLPEGFTYAEYARQGFFQLFFVALINMSLSSLIMTKVKQIGTNLDYALKALNTLTCVLTLNLLISSFYKLCLYEQAFGFTHLRLWVQCFTIALGICLIMLIAAIWKTQNKLMHRSVITLMVTYSLTGFIVNDWNIAQWNLDFYKTTNHLDTEYLIGLSVDAATPIYQADSTDSAIKNLQKRFAGHHIGRGNKNPSWYEWNFLRQRFEQLDMRTY